MPTQDTSGLKQKIFFILNQRGPSLPVHIAKGTGLSMLFASAFLSELLSERKIKISHMKVGNSPIYYIPGQEKHLENFSQHLKDKEKDAFTLLQRKKFLKDSEQLPAIRVALRAIKDFAVPFKKGEEIFWRYYLIPENQLEIPQSKPALTSHPEPPQKPQPEPAKKAETLNIFEEPKPIIKKKTTPKATKSKDKFFNEIKEFLSSKATEILDIEYFSKNELILKIKKEDKESILVAYNKKRINEDDIIKAHKKISEKYTQYSILCLGEPLKKVQGLIEAIKGLEGVEKMESSDKNI